MMHWPCTHIRTRKMYVWLCAMHTRETRSVSFALPAFSPRSYLSFFFFLSFSLAFVSFRLRGITSRRNHGNHAAGAESVGMQALICRAIRYKAIYGATGRITTSGGRLTSFFPRVRFVWFLHTPLVLEMTGACPILWKYPWFFPAHFFNVSSLYNSSNTF